MYSSNLHRYNAFPSPSAKLNSHHAGSGSMYDNQMYGPLRKPFAQRSAYSNYSYPVQRPAVAVPAGAPLGTHVNKGAFLAIAAILLSVAAIGGLAGYLISNQDDSNSVSLSGQYAFQGLSWNDAYLTPSSVEFETLAAEFCAKERLVAMLSNSVVADCLVTGFENTPGGIVVNYQQTILGRENTQELLMSSIESGRKEVSNTGNINGIRIYDEWAINPEGTCLAYDGAECSPLEVNEGFCNPPTTIDKNLVWTSTSLTIGSTATFECEAGYSFMINGVETSVPSAFCTNEQEWTPALTSCQPIVDVEGSGQ